MSEYILGLTGWSPRSHDASACIVKDGKILSMAEEERFTRRKHAYDKTPVNATRWCLDSLGLSLDDIQTVAIGWDYPKLYSSNDLVFPSNQEVYDSYFPSKYFPGGHKPPIEYVNHHLAHAACSYFLSGMDEASILIVDGQGEDVSTTYALGRGNKVSIVRSFPVKSSLGYFYEAVSDYIGLGSDSPGKTMGLAPYGNPKYQFGLFEATDYGYELKVHIPFKEGSLDQQQEVAQIWKQELMKQFGEPNSVQHRFRPTRGDFVKDVQITQLSKDIAASAQMQLQQLMAHNVSVLTKLTGVRNLCLGGGVALNCSTNSLIASSGFVDSLFIPPIANDAGCAAGAALYLAGKKSTEPINSAYFGPCYKDQEIKQVLDHLGYNYRVFDDVEQRTAQILSAGKIVSWFQGGMEIGPRALGNRSILANPVFDDMNRKVNEAKERELWRPLAPSILYGRSNHLLQEQFDSPFMLFTYLVNPEIRSIIPAIVHVDGTTRPQIVKEETNPMYYRLISEFENLSGLPLVLNTSFNGAKEPIVCTPYDALTSFHTNSTDYLVIGSYVIKK